MGYLISAHLMKQRPGSSLLRAALPKSIGFAVYEHPEVTEAAAFGVPHATLGKAVAVAVVGAVAHEDLRIFLKDRLAPHEQPVRLVTLDALPRNAGGKVDKRALREVVR